MPTDYLVLDDGSAIRFAIGAGEASPGAVNHFHPAVEDNPDPTDDQTFAQFDKDTRAAISAKISKLVHEGKPQKQAVAIALSMARRGKLRASEPKEQPMAFRFYAARPDDSPLRFATDAGGREHRGKGEGGGQFVGGGMAESESAEEGRRAARKAADDKRKAPMRAQHERDKKARAARERKKKKAAEGFGKPAEPTPAERRSDPNRGKKRPPASVFVPTKSDREALEDEGKAAIKRRQAALDAARASEILFLDDGSVVPFAEGPPSDPT